MKLSRLIAGACLTALLPALPVHANSWPSGLPVYDHVVIVLEENKDVDEVLNSNSAPYLNQLASESAQLTQLFGEEHNSEGNYFWLFAGNRFDLGYEDEIPTHDLHGSNLAQQLQAHQHSFKGYAEDLPAIGSTVERVPKAPCGGNCGYARKHVPWASFPDLCPQTTVQACVNLPFSLFPEDFSQLPTVSIVVPNLVNDMHSVADANQSLPRTQAVAREVAQGDRWLKEKMDRYYQWAKTHNSLLIVTFDENENTAHMHELTNPLSQDKSHRNHIVTLLAGARIHAGKYPEGKGLTHVNLLRTLEAMYGLPRSGSQQPEALKAGISDDAIVTDVFN
jgi:acid phosphatase